MNTIKRPNCIQCNYYYVTWDKAHPYGCKKWGLKSAVFPAMSVFNASGKHCQFFELKERFKK